MLQFSKQIAADGSTAKVQHRPSFYELNFGYGRRVLQVCLPPLGALLEVRGCTFPK
jgi:hypothetical protein